MTDWTQRNLRKTYKWAYLMLGERPGTAITVSPDEHGAPSFKFARGRDEWTWSVEHGQLIATNVGESSESVVVPLAKSEQRTKQVMPLLLTIGESTLTNQFQGAMRSSTEIDATVEAWRLVGEYAAHKGVVPTTVMLPGGPRLWRVADLSFFTSGLVQNRSGQLLDMARAGRVTTVRNVLLGALDRFAHDGSSSPLKYSEARQGGRVA